MVKRGNPAGQGQGLETGRGGDPNNRKKNVAKLDFIVKICRISSSLLNPLFKSHCGITALSLQSSFLPNLGTQQRGWK